MGRADVLGANKAIEQSTAYPTTTGGSSGLVENVSASFGFTFTKNYAGIRKRLGTDALVSKYLGDLKDDENFKSYMADNYDSDIEDVIGGLNPLTALGSQKNLYENAILDYTEKNRPDLTSAYGTRNELYKKVNDDAVEKYKKMARTNERANFAGKVGSFSGGMAGEMLDPINIALTAATLGAGTFWTFGKSSVARSASYLFGEGVINGLSEVALNPVEKIRYETLGLGEEFDRSAIEAFGEGFLVGSLLPVAFKGIGKAGTGVWDGAKLVRGMSKDDWANLTSNAKINIQNRFKRDIINNGDKAFSEYSGRSPSRVESAEIAQIQREHADEINMKKYFKNSEKSFNESVKYDTHIYQMHSSYEMINSPKIDVSKLEGNLDDETISIIKDLSNVNENLFDNMILENIEFVEKYTSPKTKKAIGDIRAKHTKASDIISEIENLPPEIKTDFDVTSKTVLNDRKKNKSRRDDVIDAFDQYDIDPKMASDQDKLYAVLQYDRSKAYDMRMSDRVSKLQENKIDIEDYSDDFIVDDATMVKVEQKSQQIYESSELNSVEIDGVPIKNILDDLKIKDSDFEEMLQCRL